MQKLFEENERQLDMFLAQGNPAMEEVSLEEQKAQAEHQIYNRNAIVNVNGSFIATSDTYKARA